MTFLEYLKLIRRHLAIILIITILGAIGGAIFVQAKNTKPFETTIFVTIGQTETANSATTAFDNVQASDYFSETVQGWLKNPEVVNRIYTKSSYSTEISTRKQVKQNFLVTFSTANSEMGTTMGNIIKDELNNEMQTYNQKTNGKFQIAIFSAKTDQKPQSIPLYIFIGIISGFILASLIVYSYEYLFKKSPR